MGKAVGILIGGVGVVSSIPSGVNFIFVDFETLGFVNFVQKCQKRQICVIRL